MKKINFAIIGCGRILKKHINAIKNIKNASIVALCDILEDKKIIADDLNCDFYINYKDLLKRFDIDVVNICVPSFLHYKIAIDSANAKKNIILEKPMAMNTIDAKKIIDVCKNNNVKLFVVKQNRYNIPVIELKKAITKKRFGKIFLANVSVRWSRDQKYYDQDDWKGSKTKDGGVFMNQAIHFVDLLQWMLGDIISVNAKVDTMTHNIESDDTGIAILKFKNGALATIDATTSIFKKNIEASITIFGENGSAKIGGFAANKMELWDFKDHTEKDKEISILSTNPPNIYGFGHNKFMKDVVNSIKNNIPAKIDGNEGIKSLKIVESIYLSAKKNKEIIL